MSNKRKLITWSAITILGVGAFGGWLWRGDVADKDVAAVTGPHPELEADPSSEFFPTVVIAKPIGWEKGETPKAAPGLNVNRFAEGLEHPRTLLTLPNGDVLVALTNAPPRTGGFSLTGMITGMFMRYAGAGGASPNRIVLLRDANGDGVAEQRFVLREGLSSPSGMAWRDGKLYVADHDALLSFPYELGATRITGAPKKLMDLPPGGSHWMRNIVISPDGAQLYVAVGSATNIADDGIDAEQGRAAIWEVDLKSGGHRQYAGGMRNPNGLDFNPSSGELWTTVNERDMLGSDLVPDYLTNVPVGAQYGWPWVYWKDAMDFRVKDPIPQYFTEYTRKPEYALGPHVSALGMTFANKGNRMGSGFGNGAFIARHGSWNRRPLSGCDVVFVPFDKLGNPDGAIRPVLTGFLTGDGTTHGRPTWVGWDKTGALLVSDDTAGIIWRVEAPGAAPAEAPPVVKSTPLPPRRELKGDPMATFREDPRNGQR